MTKLFSLIDKLATEHSLTLDEYRTLIESQNNEVQKYAATKADAMRKQIYSNHVYIRGLIEIGNVCRNDCLYCGIRRSNKNCERYILTDEEILSCCKEGYELGFRTFVLQGGEGIFSTERTCDLVRLIKSEFPDCAVTLSLGEYPYEDYQRMYEQGATVIFCGTKPQIKTITKSCIRQTCRLTTACAAFTI